MIPHGPRTKRDENGEGSEPPAGKPQQQLLILFAISIALGMFVTQLLPSAPSARVLPYSEFQTLLEEGQVERAVVSSEAIRGELAPGNGSRAFVTYPVDPGVAAELGAGDVVFEGTPSSRPRSRTPIRSPRSRSFPGTWAPSASRSSARKANGSSRRGKTWRHDWRS